MNNITHTVLEGAPRLDVYLSSKFPEISRSQWHNSIAAGLVKINTKPAKTSQSVRPGDKIIIKTVAIQPESANPQDTQVPILYEDTEVIVIDKPAGLVTYQPEGKSGESIRSILAEKIYGSGERDGIVHRLDRDTSGVLIVGKSLETVDYLKNEFKDRNVKKIYQVLIEGHMPHISARIELPISRSYKNYQKMRVDTRGKMGIMEYEVEHRYDNSELLSVTLLTGRTHQIRVQLSYLGHPVVGDSLYGKNAAPIRQFVHAAALTIKLPSGEIKTFEAPLPKDLTDYLLSLE